MARRGARSAAPAPRRAERADPARPALRRPGVHAAGAGRRSSSSKRATAKAIRERVRRALRAPLRATTRPTSRSRWSTSALAAIGKRAEADASRRSRSDGAATRRARTREVYFDDAASRSTLPGLRARRRWRPARAIDGPGAWCRSTARRRCCSPGDTAARVGAHRARLIITVGGAAEVEAERRKLDPVTLEVIRNALPAIANEMAADLQRTSYNMMIYEVRDYCTALLDPDGELISQNIGGVSHFVADLGVIITDGMKRYGRDGFKPGDVHHHQPPGGRRPAPQQRRHLHAVSSTRASCSMFAMVRAHWIDVGGMSTGFGAGPTVADPWLGGPAARPAQDLRGRQARREALPRASRTTSASRNPRSAT